MQLTQLPPLDLVVRSQQYTERTEGVHFSQILGDILSTLDPETYGVEADYGNFFAGLVWERALELAWLDKEKESRPELIRPGEIKLDGIIITPDMYNTGCEWTRGRGCPVEAKFTKKSARQGIESTKFWQYWIQLKCQAYATGSECGELWVMFVNGNYNRSGKLADGSHDPLSGYVPLGWLAEFSDIEKEEAWSMVINHGKRRGLL